MVRFSVWLQAISRWRLAGLYGLMGYAAWLMAAAPAQAHSLSDLMARSRASVVAVGYFNPTASPRFQFRGSGWVAGDGRQVITNAHVLKDEGSASAQGERLLVMVMPAGGGRAAGEPRLATVLRRMPEADLALLQIDGPALPALSLAKAPAVEGQDVALIGFPLGSILGLSPSIHRGIVSSVVAVSLPASSSQGLSAQMVNRLRAGSFEVYQLDARAHPGSSGSPLLDPETGQVLGVINMAVVRRSREAAVGEHSDISYAIPAPQVRELLTQTP